MWSRPLTPTYCKHRKRHCDKICQFNQWVNCPISIGVEIIWKKIWAQQTWNLHNTQWIHKLLLVQTPPHLSLRRCGCVHTSVVTFLPPRKSMFVSDSCRIYSCCHCHTANMSLFIGHSFYYHMFRDIRREFESWNPYVLARGGAIISSFDKRIPSLRRLSPVKIFVCVLDNEFFGRNGLRRNVNTSVIAGKFRTFILKLKHMFPMAQIYVDLCHVRCERGPSGFQVEYMWLARELNRLVYDMSSEVGFTCIETRLTVGHRGKLKWVKLHFDNSLLKSDGVHPSNNGKRELMRAFAQCLAEWNTHK